MKISLSVIILTLNEEINLPNCLDSISDWADEIFVVDCFSTDSTAQIAKRYGAKLVEHPFENQAQQFNWALDNLDIKNEWILRLDADERILPELAEEIKKILPEVSPETTGFYMKRRTYFMGKWIKYGGYYPTWILRLFRNGKARSEEREMDEHIILLEGRAEKLQNDFIDDNKKSLEWWIDKHNKFSSREVREFLKTAKTERIKAGVFAGSVGRRRWLKEKIYYRLPWFVRAFIYFDYRYFIRLGFLDGREGLIFHFLQGLWYRFLVDAKIYEAQHRIHN